MRISNKRIFRTSICALSAFTLWTAAVCIVDVGPVGPMGTRVGFSTLNTFVHSLTGVHMALYRITDWLGLIPLCFAAGFALLGLAQWISRKCLGLVDRSIIVLGAFYTLVIAVYVFFELFVVNCRPVLIDGVLEASYPSSTSVLVLCVMPTSVMQLSGRIKSRILFRCIGLAIAAFTVFMIIGRIISGVHWISDIVGGVLLSTGLVMMYHAITAQSKK